MGKTDLWIGTSFKMNKLLADALAFAMALREADASRDRRIQRFVIPPFTAVREMKAALAGSSVLVGAQNMHWEDAGAWTGEVSAPMLVDCGLDLVELGHSERRAHFGETDHTVGLKVAAAVRHGLTPLICVGETAAEREAGQADAVLHRQVTAALEGVPAAARQARILLAYEPVWAIGAGGAPASADYADARQRLIRQAAIAALGRPVPVLYGGSVNAGNAAELALMPAIDGLFIGRAAWSVAGYLDILQRVSAALAAAASQGEQP